MVFDSIEACEVHIRKCMEQTARFMATEGKKEGKRILTSQVDGITGQLFNAVNILAASSSLIEVGIENTGSPALGSWQSILIAGRPPFFPMDGLETGGTWYGSKGGRKKTHIMAEWNAWAGSQWKSLFLSKMQSLGVPIS
jgi:hypothetical protein